MITDEQAKKLEENQGFQWVGVKAVVVAEGKILLGTRMDENDHGLFELPGGKLEVGESIQDAFKREVLEETGLIIDQDSVANPLEVLEFNNRIIFLIGQVTVSDQSGLLAQTEEMADVRFYSKEEVSGILDENKSRPVFKNILTRFVEGGFDG